MPPAWVPLTLLCALCWSLADVISKRLLKRHDARSVFWGRWGYALPFLILALPAVAVPPIGTLFWPVVAVSIPLEIAAGLLYVRAIQLSPLSLSVPLLAWTPVFTALAAWIFLGEVPSPRGGAGILLVAAGSYLLASGEGRGLLEPLAVLGRERGCRYMLIVAVIYSATSALGKIGVLHSAALFFGVVYTASVTATFMVFLLLTRKGLSPGDGDSRGLFWALGAAMAAMILLHFMAIEMTQVAYMISVKRSSLIFTVLLGWLFLHEARPGRRLAGAVVMCGGMALIIF